MTRQIEFRAWDGLKMIYPDSDGWFNYCKLADYNILQSIRLDTVIKKLKTMQWTGLYDKNGKKIFENDIVEYIERLPLFLEKRIAVVEFIGGNVDYANNFLISPFINIGSFNYKTSCITGVLNNPAESTIIGNIYENPELLTQK